jgi:GTP pyrophosphokinase
VLVELRARLLELRIEAEVTGRPKHYWSIYEKMITRGKQFDDVQDLVGVRVVVDSVKDCYAALGSIHAMWKPLQGRFKDYIAMPKFNLYQSLHTTVVGPSGKAVEVQIRTHEMHRRAEYGIAAHWGYKEHEPADDLLWLQRMVDWQQEANDPSEFMETLKTDLEHDEVFVFTPKGKVVTLASGATPVDFAYAIHTDVGHRCIGARVNGRLVPLDSTLASGDTVEIFTSKVEGAGPSRDWLQFVHTPRARTKIRQWFSRERRVDAIDNGREELAKALRKEGLPVQRLVSSKALQDVAGSMHYVDLEALYAAIGERHVSAKAVVQRMQRELRGGEEQLPVTTTRPPVAPRRRERRVTGVHVEGLDDVMVRLSRCCTPVPGDEIIGFVTRGRGVSVHRSDCANAAGLVGHAERLIDVEWDHDQPATYVVSIEVEALDRSNLLRDVAQALSEHHVNILSCTSQTSSDRVARFRFEFELADPSHLDSILVAVKRIDSVFAAYRLLPGHARLGS